MLELKKLNLFKGLNTDQLARISSITKQRVYPKKTVMFVEGQGTDGIYIIISGLVKVYKLHKDGREKTLALLSKGEIIGEMTLIDNEIRSATVETLEQSTFLYITKNDFQKVLIDIPDLSLRLVELLSNRLRQANRQIEELIFLNARSRVICNLLQLVKEQGQKDGDNLKISLKLTHIELAKLIGVTRETVTKVLAELQDCKLIEIKQKQICFHDIEKLNKEIL